MNAGAAAGQGLSGSEGLIMNAKDHDTARGGICHESEPHAMHDAKTVGGQASQGEFGWSNTQAGALALTATLVGGVLVALLQGGQSGGR